MCDNKVNSRSDQNNHAVSGVESSRHGKVTTAGVMDSQLAQNFQVQAQNFQVQAQNFQVQAQNFQDSRRKTFKYMRKTFNPVALFFSIKTFISPCLFICRK